MLTAVWLAHHGVRLIEEQVKGSSCLAKKNFIVCGLPLKIIFCTSKEEHDIFLELPRDVRGQGSITSKAARAEKISWSTLQ